MNQTGVIFFGLLVGFVVFITVRGELAAYLDVIGLGANKAPGGTSNGVTVTLPPVRV